MVLLSPLTFPHPTLDHHHYQQQQQHLQAKTVAAIASLPSPPLPTPEDELAPPAKLVSLLLPLSIPSNSSSNSLRSPDLLTPPPSARSPPLIAPATSQTPTETDDASLPWFNHPHSLANIFTKKLEGHTQPQPQPQRRPHHHQYRQHRPQLPDPALASQLLSTISSKDLTRLYVHAAHHLHSHQPIRRYVMMKMIMTQAEMPRAPGPSTGAQPKRNGFGSPAQSGFAFRPKNPSKLGRYMSSSAMVSAPAARWGTAHSNGGRVRGDDSGMEVWNEKTLPTTTTMTTTTELKHKKSISLPWTQSLSSFVSLTKRKPSKPTASVSEPNLYCSSRRLEELELGHHDYQRKSAAGGAKQQGGNKGASRLRRRLYSEDDYDDEEGSEDTETGDDFEGGDDNDEDEEEEEEQPRNYWTMLRSRNDQSRKRDPRTTMIEKDQHNKEARLHLIMQQQQQDPSKEQQQYIYHQQQQQQQQQRTKQQVIPLQQLDPQVIIYTSSTKANGTHSKSKNARRRTAMGPSGNSAASSLLPTGTGSASASFTETYGVSGLVMLFLFLFLLEGINQFYKVQSALLSIIL
ncbi:hypothetical protein BGX23_011340 [Mortierella sp. AD031]|nr:hypothetical protein BGX23_011340 [Mortierella sp. AD031]